MITELQLGLLLAVASVLALGFLLGVGLLLTILTWWRSKPRGRVHWDEATLEIHVENDRVVHPVLDADLQHD